MMLPAESAFTLESTVTLASFCDFCTFLSEYHTVF